MRPPHRPREAVEQRAAYSVVLLESRRDDPDHHGIRDQLPLVHVGTRELPELGAVLDDMRHELLRGRGFVLIRGVPVQRYSVEEAALAYFGMGTYFGEAVSQNAKGHALGHVYDLGFDANLPLGRGYQTSSKLHFHTDPADIVGLLCLKTAKSGGLSSIVSSGAVYNAMLEQRPDLVQVLTQTIYRDRRGEIPEGGEPWIDTPVERLKEVWAAAIPRRLEAREGT